MGRRDGHGLGEPSSLREAPGVEWSLTSMVVGGCRARFGRLLEFELRWVASFVVLLPLTREWVARSLARGGCVRLWVYGIVL